MKYTKWEYTAKVIRVDGQSLESEDTEKLLNQYGSEGWEAFAIKDACMFFKRPLEK